MLVGAEGVVGGGIERVFNVYAEAGVFLEVGVAKQRGVVAFGEVVLQVLQTAVGQCRLPLS